MADNILPDTNRPGHESLQERVYQQLRFDIMTGKFVPGKAVTIRGLAEEMGTSPMPVREALRRLVAEQALQLLPNRRVTVPDMNVEKYREIAEARVALEPLAARRAFPYITEELKIGRASCRERVVRAVYIAVVDVCVQKKHIVR